MALHKVILRAAIKATPSSCVALFVSICPIELLKYALIRNEDASAILGLVFSHLGTSLGSVKMSVVPVTDLKLR